MTKLFFDNFLREQDFSSTEEYIAWCLNERVPARFNNARYYRSLWNNGLIRKGFSIRTSDAGQIDEHYWADANGNLVGAVEGPYPGKKGVFRPEEILAGQRISDGWTIESESKLSYHFRRWIKKQKK